MKNVYVFFFDTPFFTGRAIRFFTHNKYSHVALSFDPNTQMLYSYARYRYREPFLSGFGVEYTDRYSGSARPVDIKVCEVAVTDEHYERIKRHIAEYTAKQGSTRYNFFDVLAYPFNHHVELDLTHTCLSFLLELLEEPDIHTIRQLELHLQGCKVYEGPLFNYDSRPTSGPIDFYERRRRTEVIGKSSLELLQLTASLIKKYI